ncbi:MAG: hypothetical protein WKF76_10335 [Nocardioidaceae bacterium]
MAEQLTFFGWFQPPATTLPSARPSPPAGWPRSIDLTLTDMDDPSDHVGRPLRYDLLGPGDVTGLKPAAVVRTYPSAGARAVEIDKAVYAELRGTRPALAVHAGPAPGESAEAVDRPRRRQRRRGRRPR